ncbi:DUF6789 family protein [Microbispora sp. NPDC049125]|uniref:DUF6789 family protein n=1 Tax=Microbispora sp. NPDC049125 TaxID=3154929 RepID=UPI003464F500
MMRNVVNGAVGGALATAVYSAVLMAGDRAGLIREKPPRRVARTVMSGRSSRPVPGENIVGTIAHYAFGAGCGSVLGLLSAGQRLPAPIGAAYGLVVWYLGHQGLAPAVGAYPPASRDSRGRQAVLVAGHLVWGTSLAIALNRLRIEKMAVGTGQPARDVRRHRTPSPQPVHAF